MNNVISYYRACYQSDNRELNLWNIFSKKHEHLHIIEGEEELLNAFLPRIPIPKKYAENVQKSVEVYRREKDLLYCPFFLTGTLPSKIAGRTRKICAPILYFYAKLEQEKDDWFLHIDPSAVNINFSIINELLDNNQSIKHDLDFLNQAITGTTVGNLSSWLESISHRINTSEVFRYPKLSNTDTINHYLNKKSNSDFFALPGSAIVMVKKSLNTRGILHDLKSMAAQASLSTPINTLFGFEKNAARSIRPKSADPDNVPGILSDPQKKILRNASYYDQSLVIGPPGTGKSYTIAAIAIDRYIKGESVLIVSQTENAVDIIHNKLVSHLKVKDSVIRAGQQDYLKRLKDYIDIITSGMANKTGENTFSISYTQLEKLKSQINKKEKLFLKRCKQAIKDGKLIQNQQDSGGNISILSKLRLFFAKRRILNSNSLSKDLLYLQQENEKREQLLSQYIDLSYQKQLQITLNKDRKQLLNFSKAMRARSSQKQAQYFEEIDYKVLLNAFPIWLVSLGSIHKVLPLYRELFDVVIIDEATQCDVASCLPALYRAKRSVIVGDPKQLRHVSFLSKDRQLQLAKKHDVKDKEININYRDNSILDICNENIESQHAVTMLDEHYRSKPAIIHFSNTTFYNAALKVMTNKPATCHQDALQVIPCNGERINGVNKVEAEHILEHVRSIVSQELNKLPQHVTSIGVLSPFRDQVDYLQKLLEKSLSLEEMLTHKISVGTAYAFQGDERDVMLISLCIDNNSSINVYNYMNRSDVFNVSITRAREQQFIYSSILPGNVATSTHLYKYLQLIKQSQLAENIEAKQFDEYQEHVCQLLNDHQFQTWKNFIVAGASMDIIVKKGDRVAAIDLIGFPGEFADYYHIDRYKLFERAGIAIFPLSYGAWVHHRQRFIDELAAFIDNLTSTAS